MLSLPILALVALPTGAFAASYDYIVVGGGTAGAALASRIAEDRTVTVALMEAGDDQCQNNLFAYTPGADVIGVGSDPKDTVSYDWNYVTQPQAGAAGRKVHYAKGKCIGGSSQRNFMIYQRPTADSFGSWEAATSGVDSPGWAWEDVYKYFVKSPALTAASPASRGPDSIPPSDLAAFPGTTNKSASPLTVGYAAYTFPYTGTLRSAFNELGYPNATGFNSGTLNGIQYCSSTIDARNMHRASSQYFVNNAQQTLKLSNLKVILNARATKVNFDSNKNAVSVTYRDNYGVPRNVTATREIVVSAGAFGSPQLLMLSGIGPAAQLKKFNIPVISDLPGVGQNMEDHIFFSPAYEIQKNIPNFGHEAQLLDLLVAGLAGFFSQGSLTNPVADILAWQRLNDTFLDSKPELQVLKSYPALWPHVEFIGAGGFVGNFTNLLADNSKYANMNRYFYSLLGTLVAPQSKGTVTLASADGTKLPNIDPNWLTSPTDQAVAIEVYRKIRRIFATNAFASARLNRDEFFPGLDKQSDAEILSVIQNSLLTVWHAACTCAMKPQSQGGVLDPYLRVYGVNKLRVVDASSMPQLPPGHPQSTIYMLAERAADLIALARGASITTPNVQPPATTGVPYSGPN